jgi:prepilin-type N-terminal cleavage/methylation domain-containing protein
MVKRPSRNAGFTLTEAMMVVAILGIVFAIGPEIFQRSTQFFLLHRTKLELQREARTSISIVNKHLRQAQSATIVLDRVSTAQPLYSRLRFTTVDGVPVTFYQSGKSFLGEIGSSKATLSQNIRYLAFALPRSDDMGIVSLSLTLEKSTYERYTKALHMASEKVRVMN